MFLVQAINKKTAPCGICR